MLLNTFSHDKTRQNCETAKMPVSKCLCLTFSAGMSCLDAKISLVPKHQLMVPSTVIWSLQHKSKQTKPQSHKDTYAHTTDI